MSSHIGRTYLNSCLKVPIDPCNNCPAPVFSRPKMYLGCLSVTPNTPHTAVIPKHCSTTEMDRNKWSCSGIRSLANLYNSIPDYRDLNHLSGEEFSSTLDTLRSACRELKVKTSCSGSEDHCSTTTPSSIITSSAGQLEGSRKSKKSKKKKSTEIKTHKKIYDSQEADFTPEFLKTEEHENCNQTTETKMSIKSDSKSPKKDLDEVGNLKNSLKEFEVEFKRPLTSLNRNESRSFTRHASKEFVGTNQNDKRKLIEKVPVRSNFTTTLRERLGKSWSFNDLHSLTEPPELLELRKQNKTLELLSFKARNNKWNDPKKLSNYFQENSKLETTEISKLIVDSPSVEQSFIDRLRGKPKSQQKRTQNEEYKMPFKLFELDTCKKRSSIKHSTPSPLHPVARPNLAATLRAESSKRKVQELKNNCTFLDTRTQFDWEVRKTPAWKTLSLNETHKEILQLRLATRKAEQALQQREYELNMELMRERVKSAPLLLEGPTYWGPHVGKLTHACQKEGRRHMCELNQQRTRRRKKSSRGHSCRRKMLFSTSSTLEEDNFDNSINTFRVQKGSNAGISHNLKALSTIYGRNGNGAKSQSRNSSQSTNTQPSLKCQNKMNSNNIQKSHKTSCKDDTNYEAVEIDSADELSSLDRAFL